MRVPLEPDALPTGTASRAFTTCYTSPKNASLALPALRLTMRDRHRTRPAPRTPVRRKLAAPNTTPKGWLPKARHTFSKNTPKKLLERMRKAADIVASKEASRQYQESEALADCVSGVWKGQDARARAAGRSTVRGVAGDARKPLSAAARVRAVLRARGGAPASSPHRPARPCH